jgi:mannose-6-phosphate isomerase-like protein (cupin superfamily)
MELEIRNLGAADEVKEIEKGRFELASVAGLTVGRATYEPGWRWSEHVGAARGQRSCAVEHVILVLSGRMRIAMDDGREVDVGPGDLCAVPPGHDAWVLGDEPYVSLHFAGAQDYV